MTKVKRIKRFAFINLLLFTFAPSIYAKAGTISIPASNIDVGQTQTYTIGLSSNIASVDGTITSSDPTCVEVVSVDSQNGSGNYFMEITMTKKALQNAGTVTIKGLKNCQTTLKISDASMASLDEEEETNLTFYSGIIKVGTGAEVQTSKKEETNSQNNSQTNQNTTNNENSDNQNVSNGTNNENKQNESQSNNVSNTNEVNNSKEEISSSTKNDNKSVNKNINSNLIAKNDDISNTNLSSLSVEGYDIDFNSNVLEYSINVGSDVDSLSIMYKLADQNAKVEIKGNDKLVVGENIISITITAENKKSKTYLIKVNKEQDPNKEYDDNNYLKTLDPTIGILSPVFDKDVLNYVIYLPYEETNIDFNIEIENEETSTFELLGDKELKVGDNEFKIKVKAESGKIREYKVLVKRADLYNTSSNSFLKSITLENGTLVNNNKDVEFDKNVTTYYYKKGDNFSYKYETEDPNAKVTVKDENGVINIIVEAPNGQTRIYTLIPLETSVIKKFALLIIGIIIGYLLRIIISKLIKANKRRKRETEI